MDLARLTYKSSWDSEDGEAANRAPIASVFCPILLTQILSSHIYGRDLFTSIPMKSPLLCWLTSRSPSPLLFLSIPDYSSRWMYGGGRKILAHEALLLFWVWGCAGRPALHHERESTVLLLLLRVSVRRVLRYLRRTHRYESSLKKLNYWGCSTAFIRQQQQIFFTISLVELQVSF